MDFLKNKLLPALKWFLTSFIWVFVIMLVLDIVTKQLIIKNVAEGERIDLIPGFLGITHILNYNAAFGHGIDNEIASRIVFCIIAALASIAIVFIMVWKYKKIPAMARGCLMLILTGAVGNLIDRLFYGPEYAVIDWIDFYGIWNYVFNIADCCVVIGAIALIIFLIVDEVKNYIKQNKSEKSKEK